MLAMIEQLKLETETTISFVVKSVHNMDMMGTKYS